MKVLVTGSAGRVGRHIYIHLMQSHQVVGMDTTPCSTADYIGDIRDLQLIRTALNGVDVVVHTASLHAPHIGVHDEQEFMAVNVKATEQLAKIAVEQGVKQIVYTSTTALYGYASKPVGIAGWITEEVTPQPRTIYHKSKIEAETVLQRIAQETGIAVTVLQMSRCFPEPADEMAVFRLTRGIDARDVASAHGCAIGKRPAGFSRYIISGKTPFSEEDCSLLYRQADRIIEQKVPQLALEFDRRGWQLPKKLDRVYDSSLAQKELGWFPKFGFEGVFDYLDSGIAEVLHVQR